MRYLLAFALLFCWAGLAQAQPAIAQPNLLQPAPPRLVQVSGSATQRIAPDRITWNLSTLDAHADLKQAKAASDAKLKALLAAARGLGIEDAAMQTGQLGIDQQIKRSEDGSWSSTSPRQFVVRRSLTIETDQLQQFDAFYSAFVEAADVEIGTHFSNSRQTELRWEIRTQAVQLARRKAEAMAEAAGARLGRLANLSEQASGGWPYQQVFTNQVMTAPAAAAPGEADNPQGSTFVPGMIEITVRVEAAFELAD